MDAEGGVMLISSYGKGLQLGAPRHPRHARPPGPGAGEGRWEPVQLRLCWVGELVMRSRGTRVYADIAPNLFKPAVETVVRLHEEGKLVDGWTYRGEALHKPRHNALEYERTPIGGVILFEVDRGDQDLSPYMNLLLVGQALGLEVVPQLGEGYLQG